MLSSGIFKKFIVLFDIYPPPATYDTLKTHFQDTWLTPADYDLIATSDLGLLGHEIVTDFFAKDGVKMDNYTDCGLLIYDLKAQDVHCGGSGYGCFRRGDMGRHLVKRGIAAQVLWGISTLYRRHRAVSKIVEKRTAPSELLRGRCFVFQEIQMITEATSGSVRHRPRQDP